jgi:sigma-B regulation protein RsbU (phosphoserine phosphatase)
MMIVNSLIAGLSLHNDKSNEILASTNAIMKPRIRKNMMMSAVMLRWNESEKSLFYTGAGHEYILVYRASQGTVMKIKSGGVALGMVKDISKVLKEQPIPFEPNDIVILYTDGISEARLRSEKNGTLF